MSNGAMSLPGWRRACTWREEGRGRREEGGRPAAYLEGGRQRLAVDGVWARFHLWRLAALARWRLENWRLGDFVSAAPGHDG
jgi:hypothetical protein